MQVAIKEVGTADLEALLNTFARILIHAVVRSTSKDHSDGGIAIFNFAMLTNVLDAPVAILATSDVVKVGQNLVDARTLVILVAVLEDVLHNKTAGFADCNLSPLANKSSVDCSHDHRWWSLPAELEQLLPNVASISMNNGVADAGQQFTHHLMLESLGNAVEGLLNDVAAKCISAKTHSVSFNMSSQAHDLVVVGALEDALNKEVAKAITHELETTIDDGVDDGILERWLGVLDLLLEEYGRLLVVARDDLVDDHVPVRSDARLEELAPVDLLSRMDEDVLTKMRWVEDLTSRARTRAELCGIGVETRRHTKGRLLIAIGGICVLTMTKRTVICRTALRSDWSTLLQWVGWIGRGTIHV